MTKPLPSQTLMQLQRWNTPTVYNGWEILTKKDRTCGSFNAEPVVDYMPNMGPMVGYAVTVVIEPSNAAHANNKQDAVDAYFDYVAGVNMPKIVVVQDLDTPHVGSFWGEINANTHKALGCVGTITHGAIRDLDEMHHAGFKAIAKRMCVGHAYSTPVRFGCDVEVFGCKISPGQLIHADQHGFLVIEPQVQEQLYDALVQMDAFECAHFLSFLRSAAGRSMASVLDGLKNARRSFVNDVKAFAKSKQEEANKKGGL